MSQSDKQEVWHLLCLRIAESGTQFFNANEKPVQPQWVIEVGKKLWRDFLPKTILPSEQKLREVFVAGFAVGILPQNSRAIDVNKSLQEIRASGAYSPIDTPTGQIPTYVELLNQIGSGLSELLSEAPQIKVAFARGLESGATVQVELESDLFGQGGSPRRIILLHLWLHWPEIEKSKSVANVYRRLSAALDTVGYGNLMGDQERFKKIAQDVGLRFEQKKRQGKSKRS